MAFRGRFPIAQSGVLTKNVLLFGTISMHVALLVTEISRQDQNFRVVLRIYCQIDYFCV